MKTIIITTIYAIICVSGMFVSAAAYMEAANCPLNIHLGVHVDPLPYIAVGLSCFIGLLASIHYFNRNQ